MSQDWQNPDNFDLNQNSFWFSQAEGWPQFSSSFIEDNWEIVQAWLNSLINLKVKKLENAGIYTHIHILQDGQCGYRRQILGSNHLYVVRQERKKRRKKKRFWSPLLAIKQAVKEMGNETKWPCLLVKGSQWVYSISPWLQTISQSKKIILNRDLMIHQTNYPPGFVLYASVLFKLFSKKGTVTEKWDKYLNISDRVD